MKNFKKIINPCSIYDTYYKKNLPVFIKIKYQDKKLSINGVIAPQKSGNCLGSCGQILDILIQKDIKFNENWSKKDLNKLYNIWSEWHLNDMCAYTPEMKKQGWDKLAKKPINKYNFSLTNDAIKEKNKLKDDILKLTKQNKLFKLSLRQKKLLDSKFSLDIYDYKEPKAPEFMELSKYFSTKKPKIEQTTLGWVSYKEHKDGLLGKMLNGKGYGSLWYMHEVPEEKLNWLYGLPESNVKPWWV